MIYTTCHSLLAACIKIEGVAAGLIEFNRTMTHKQIYMILSAVGDERGQPIGFYHDLFKARADFNALNDMHSAFTGSLTAFLIAYEIQKGGALMELQELGRK